MAAHKKGGELIHVEVFSHKIIYLGRPAMLVLAIDVTRNILLQQQLTKERNDRQNEIMKATVAVQEKERNQLGDELHDNVNQILTSARLYMECVGLYDDKKEEYRLSSLELLRRGVEEIRCLSKSMVPPRLKDVGLIQSIIDVLNAMSALRPIDIEFCHAGFDENKIDDGLKLAIYRMVQEQTTNILKYADASKVTVRLHYWNTSFLVLTIRDNGQGFDTAACRKGIGLTNIMNRASIYHGKVDIKSSPGRGCRLRVFFDFPAGD